MISYLHNLQKIRAPSNLQFPKLLHLAFCRLFSPRQNRLKKALQLKQQMVP